MCGIVGILSNSSTNHEDLNKITEKMALAISYRGPDDMGVWSDIEHGIALGHRRLSILDLSAAGHQPMHSNSHRYVIAFNGEIYNHLEIRAELQNIEPNIIWSGHSDTETLLAAFEKWGIIPTLNRTVGMFAIALWDKETKKLHLIRDRIGEKPLYYGWTNNGHDNVKGQLGQDFIFGSELKALTEHPKFYNQISRSALANYLRFMYVPAPQSIYQDIYKLEPGCILSISEVFPASPNEMLRAPLNLNGLSLTRWWSLANKVESGLTNLITNETDALEQLELRLKDSVSLQSLSDVPLGAFLSGGVDSSTIVALMQEQCMNPVKTFTVGFEESGFDESPFAKEVAKHLGTDHSELFVTASEAMAVIPLLASMYDEPFADSSQIPTHLVCKAARQHVTVALSGDAGDELFGGYNRYFWGPRIWNRISWLPYSTRQILGSMIAGLPINIWDSLSKPINAMLPNSSKVSRLGDKAHKLAHRLSTIQDLDGLYWSLVSEWEDPANSLLIRDSQILSTENISQELFNPLNINFPTVGLEESQQRMMYFDSMTYLPDDILCKVDRAAMATSLETRVPFLDHRVVELAWQLPLNMKIRDNKGKWALRQVLYKYVPKELIERPKAGFGIPIGQWLRGPLKDWANSLLDERVIRSQGYFKVEIIQKKWQEHIRGDRDNTTSLWSILMFQSWITHQGSLKGKN
ncbi:asparagine synthase (glutamine-hydrolyzing) [Polynucleobacter rarus]|uniref:asparagine synthase (glutamine-hydrolyzing) n=1 Tax=Polynucleobacter rarus TaxID=556055 RepID=UPI000D3E4E07|nr:asparagine synthase (glutamine-hydrolyzing) [Polynucleobacter rarus]